MFYTNNTYSLLVLIGLSMKTRPQGVSKKKQNQEDLTNGFLTCDANTAPTEHLILSLSKYLHSRV